MPALYEIAEAIRGVLTRLDKNDGELPVDLAADLDALEMAFEEKAENICRYRVGLCAAADGIDAEIRRLTQNLPSSAKETGLLPSTSIRSGVVNSPCGNFIGATFRCTPRTWRPSAVEFKGQWPRLFSPPSLGRQ